MTKIKTSELTRAAIDWAVAKCEGEITDLEYDGITWGFKLDGKLKVLAKGWAASMSWHPSTNWAQGGPIIEREEIDTVKMGVEQWRGRIEGGNPVSGYGPTILIAAMRCYVASKLGETVDVPEELTK
jgi:hypothetical protein